MAPVGQEATRVGISHILGRSSWSITAPGVDAEDRDVGAVHRAAHVEAAGEGDAQLAGRSILAGEVREELVHHRLDHAGGVGRREWQCTQPWVWTMLEIELPDAADRVAELVELLDQGLDLGLVGEQELDVVAAGEPQVAVAVLVGQVAELRIV